jgi:hypothetical protein
MLAFAAERTIKRALGSAAIDLAHFVALKRCDSSQPLPARFIRQADIDQRCPSSAFVTRLLESASPRVAAPKRASHLHARSLPQRRIHAFLKQHSRSRDSASSDDRSKQRLHRRDAENRRASRADQRYFVLFGWPAAICRARYVSVAQAFKLKHQLDAFLACDDDSLQLRTLRECNHGFKNIVAFRSAMGLVHDRHQNQSATGCQSYYPS